MKVITLNLLILTLICILKITVNAGELIVGFDSSSIGHEEKEEIKKICLIEGFTDLNNSGDSKNSPQLFKRLASNDGMFLISLRKCQSSNNQLYIITEIINAYNEAIIFYQVQEGADVINNFRGNKKNIFEMIENCNKNFFRGKSDGINLSIMRNEPCNKLYSIFINSIIEADDILMLTLRYGEECLLIKRLFFANKQPRIFERNIKKRLGTDVVCIIQENNDSNLKIKAINSEKGTVIYEQAISTSLDIELFIKNILLKRGN